MSLTEVEPFFFGDEDRRLYGCYDRPKVDSRDTAILLCGAVGPEYFTSHRGLRRLAIRLAQRRFPVLRFDYLGTGDSSGASHRVSLSSMRHDWHQALTELRRRSGCSKVVVVGQRLGGTLVASAAVAEDGVSALVLWDPVVRGADLVSAIVGDRAFAPPEGGAGSPPVIESDGFSWPEPFCDDLRGLDIFAVKPASVRTLVVETEPDGDGETLAEGYRARGAETDYLFREMPRASVDQVDRIAVPAKVIDAIVEWIEGPGV